MGSLQESYNAAGTRTDYTYQFDDNSKQVVIFDVDNIYSWNTQTEPLRDCRRLVGLSYAAMVRLSMAAVAA
jgi:hypothetical protein